MRKNLMYLMEPVRKSQQYTIKELSVKSQLRTDFYEKGLYSVNFSINKIGIYIYIFKIHVRLILAYWKIEMGILYPLHA